MIGYRGECVLMYSSKSLHDELKFQRLLRIGQACKAAENANPTVLKDGRRELGIIENTKDTGSVFVSELGPSNPDFGPTN